jgi:hypothetical protein
MRDIDEKPYTPDEARVAAFFFERGIGGGDDPIGSMMAGYAFLVEQRNQLQVELDYARKTVAALSPSP